MTHRVASVPAADAAIPEYRSTLRHDVFPMALVLSLWVNLILPALVSADAVWNNLSQEFAFLHPWREVRWPRPSIGENRAIAK